MFGLQATDQVAEMVDMLHVDLVLGDVLDGGPVNTVLRLATELMRTRLGVREEVTRQHDSSITRSEGRTIMRRTLSLAINSYHRLVTIGKALWLGVTTNCSRR